MKVEIKSLLNDIVEVFIFIFFPAHNIEDCARESMKFEIRKYDFETALDEIRTNQKALEMAQITASNLITSESGFSSTQEPISSTPSTITQQQSARRTAGYSEYDELNEGTDLLEHLNIDQHGNNQNNVLNSNQQLNSEDQEIANSLKFLAERFSRILLWFETKDSKEKFTYTPKELIEQFHQAKFIDRSIVNIHKPATYVEIYLANIFQYKYIFNYRKTQAASKRGVIQDAGRIRKSIAKCFLNAPDYVRFTDETGKFLEAFDL